MSRLQPARGTADLLPDSMAKHRSVIDAARTASARYGFQEMATPIFEFSEVFSRPLGESSDIVTKENYSFADRGGEILTLRPENTAGVVRAMISGGLTQSLPLKYFYAGPMFRYERPQKGRMRQFHQVGIEYLGPDDSLADAEIIACGARFLASLGVLDDCELHLNSLGDSDSRAAYRAALIAYLETFADQLSDDSKTRLAVNPLRILDSKDAGDRAILQDAPRLQDYLNDVSKAHFADLTAALDSAGVAWVFDPLLVRGLDYYCHTAFEFVTTSLGAQGTVLGGGRYDGLAEMLGGPKVAGVGWAAGVERLAMLVETASVNNPKVAILTADDGARQAAFRLAEQLRDAGIDIDLPTSGGMGKKLKKADKAGIWTAVIMGSDELAKNTVQLRNLRDGSQQELPLDPDDCSGLAAAIAESLLAP
ncbi:histidine--tRNA ligase [Alphaproteobacteria bacterium]|jgi:histidyl-tRNA synthetase|nr:histidine--tRNA ligase [Alphaproteobacteria bacterium]MDC3193089.1 histidine--tRNA ligase [Alphaproteobacteria bacterium]